MYISLNYLLICTTDTHTHTLVLKKEAQNIIIIISTFIYKASKVEWKDRTVLIIITMGLITLKINTNLLIKEKDYINCTNKF